MRGLVVAHDVEARMQERAAAEHTATDQVGAQVLGSVGVLPVALVEEVRLTSVCTPHSGCTEPQL